MNRNIEQEAERLDAFITSRLSATQAAEQVPADQAQVVSELAALAASAQPDPAFAGILESELMEAAKRQAAAKSRAEAKGEQKRRANPTRPRGSVISLPAAPSLWRWRPAWGLAAASLIIIGIVLALASRPSAANAQEIVDKARASAESPAAAGIQSFELQETSTLRTDTGETVQTKAARWFRTPANWRAEIETAVTGPNGQQLGDRASASLSITDGADVWYLDQKKNAVTISPLPGNSNGQENITAFGVQPDSLGALFKQASSCFDPRLQGSDTVAGRAVYIVDLGVMKCAGAGSGVRSVIWVDQETFFVLKSVQYGANGSEPQATTEVTSVRYNPSLDASLFTFVPPAGATVQDFRAKPAPAPDQFQQQLESLAKQAKYPILVPDYVPAGLEPRQPRDSSIGGLELDYVPHEQVDKPSAAILSGLLINEQAATYDLVVKWTEGAKPVTISQGKAWLRTDAPNPVGGGMDRAAYVLQDGTLVSIASFAVDPAELVKVAGSLRTVSGSHAPLPDPTPPVLAALRQKLSFPLFVPANVPAGLTPEPPLGGDKPGSSVEIDYHAADGRIALAVVSGPLDCCSDLRMVKGQDITLAAGVTAHLIQDPEDSSGGWTLWWEQEGALVRLSGASLTRAELISIANSMDKTADIGQVGAAPVRPTPGPLPAPRFKVLEPAWLPESMTRQQDYQAAPPEFGSWAALTFLPNSGDVRTPLILLEKPLALMGERSVDPNATKVKIGSYDVTVTGTASECWNYDWGAGDIHLSLANAYNASGSARYTCEQMSKIVESIR